MAATPKLQPYDLIPHVLKSEPLAKSSMCGGLCKVGSCPVIGSFLPGNMYVESKVFRDPNETHRLFVVLDYPDANPDEFWHTPRGKFLTSMIMQQRGSGMSVAVGFMTKCRPVTSQMVGKGGKARPVADFQSIQYCSPHLFEEIDNFKPHGVALVGNDVSKAFLGDGVHGTYSKIKWLQYLKSSPETLVAVTALPGLDTVARTPYQGAAFRVAFAKLAFWAKTGKDTYDRWRVRGTIVRMAETEEDLVKWEGLVESVVANPEYRLIGFDTETESLSKSKNRIYSFGFCVHPDVGYAVTLDHPRSVWTDAQKERIRTSIRKLMMLPDRDYLAHNSGFDIGIMSICLNIRLRRCTYDTQAIAHALEEEFQSKEYRDEVASKFIHRWQGLDPQTEFWLDFEDHGWKNMKSQRASLAALPCDKVDEYCALDNINMMRVFYASAGALYNKSPTAYASIDKIIRPINYVLSHIEESGIPINYAKIKYHLDPSNPDSAAANLIKLQEKFLAMPRVKELNQRLVKENGKKFLFKAPNLINLGSSQHMQTLFYDIIGHEGVEEYDHKTGENKTKRSTDKNFLEELVEERWEGWEEAAALLEYRQYTKLIGTFLTGFTDNANGHADHRVRANYHCTRTVTHRLSASDPNPQQIPRGGEASNKAKGFVKEVIEAPEGYSLVGADYGTAEVRVAAIASNDHLLAHTFNNAENLKNAFLKKPMIEAFEKWKFEGDAHRSNASAAYGVPIRQVTGDQRQAAKNVSFLCVYSADPAPQLAIKINSSVEEAQKVVDGFLGKFKDLQEYLKSRDVIAENFGLIHTPLGRTRSLYAAMFPENKKAYKHAINQARNTGIQSSASDLLLLALYKFICYIEDNGLPWRIVNVVHDSVLGLVPIGDELEFGNKMKYFMENPGIEEFGFDPAFCAMTADAEIGRSYAGQTAWDGTPEHYARIEKWITAGANPDDEPESRFSEYLGALGKFEKMQSKIEKDGAAATDEDHAALVKLQDKLDSIKAVIAEEYGSAIVEEAVPA